MSCRNIRPVSLEDLPVEIIWMITDLLPDHVAWSLASTNATMKKVAKARFNMFPDWKNPTAIILTDSDRHTGIRAEIIRFLHLIQRDHPGTAICSLCRSLQYIQPMSNIPPNLLHVKNPCKEFSEVANRCNVDPGNLLADLVEDADIKQKDRKKCMPTHSFKCHHPCFHYIAPELDTKEDFQQRLRFQLCLDHQELGPLYGKAVPSCVENIPNFPVPISRQRGTVTTPVSSDRILKLQDTIRFGPYSHHTDIQETFRLLDEPFRNIPGIKDGPVREGQLPERPHDPTICRRMLENWVKEVSWVEEETKDKDNHDAELSISRNHLFSGRCQHCRTEYRLLHKVSPLEAGERSSRGQVRIETELELSRELATMTDLYKELARDIAVIERDSHPSSDSAEAPEHPSPTW
ncbi:hypothetical protein EV356DRAFT_527849 [Viridothelium virens]|uniref:F-box domain-containing protein n=1 Tax=Viridothelium virens TaxID=1048519 RepID=A0A6A6HPD7_VIRVR|nr:hypothetical protein EV356DRAFT_527849 [Viridothelium virens]